MDYSTIGFAVAAVIAVAEAIALLKRRNPEQSAAPAAPAAPASAAPASAAPAAADTPSQEVVAAVSAALAEELGTDITRIRILSIQKL